MHPLISGDLARVVLNDRERALRERAERSRANRPGMRARLAARMPARLRGDR